MEARTSPGNSIKWAISGQLLGRMDQRIYLYMGGSFAC